ncbi:flavoprotein [bacterium]|nr:flavoprotein [bacterium]
MSAKHNIILGVSGGIAAYKAADLASALSQANYSVHVIMTKHAQELIKPATFRALTKNPVLTKMFIETTIPIPHIDLAEEASLIVVAPATANIIGKIAHGFADDVLTTTIMASKAPKIIVPSMNTNMWENQLVQENIEKLKKHDYEFVEPEFGPMACGTIGKGRYPNNDIIIKEIEKHLK